MIQRRNEPLTANDCCFFHAYYSCCTSTLYVYSFTELWPPENTICLTEPCTKPWLVGWLDSCIVFKIFILVPIEIQIYLFEFKSLSRIFIVVHNLIGLVHLSHLVWFQMKNSETVRNPFNLLIVIVLCSHNNFFPNWQICEKEAAASVNRNWFL